MTFLVDTRAEISVITRTTMNESFGLEMHLNKTEITDIRGIAGDKITSMGTIEIAVGFGDGIEHPTTFHVVPEEFNIPSDGILGKDFVKNYICNLDYESMTFTVKSRNGTSVVNLDQGPDQETVVLPARAEVARCSKFTWWLPQELAPGVMVAVTMVSPHTNVIRIM